MSKSRMRTMLFQAVVLACFLPVFAMECPAAQADAKTITDTINAVLDKECVRLRKDKLRELLFSRFSSDIEKGLPPEFSSILQGVIKRTDFDNISEEKTAEIIGLVYGSFKKGAPLEYLDQLFDVAYVKTISVDNLTAAAKALKEFHHSDVPQDVAEEFVYHSLEDGWDPSAIPALVRGLMYGVERGLTSHKVALIIMLDVRNGELKKKKPDQLVLDAITLVREKEPNNWKPLKKSEKELAAKQDRMRKLEELRQMAEAKKRQQEIDKKKAEETLQRMRVREEDRARMAEQEKHFRQIDRMLRAYQAEITRYQAEQHELNMGMAAYRAAQERENQQRDRKREETRKKQLDDLSRSIMSYGRSGRLDLEKLYTAVDRYMNVPYRYGGDSDLGMDCSAFTRRVYRPQNVELPRSSYDQSLLGVGVGAATLQVGDLVFFDASITGRISHVGVYLGNGVFAHASSSAGVTKSSLREQYYAKRFVKAGRIFGP